MYKPSTADGFRRVRMSRIASTVGALVLFPLFAAACVFGDEDPNSTVPANGESTSPASSPATGNAVRQDSISLTKGGFEPDAVEVDEGAVVRVTNDTDGPMTIIVSGGDSDTEFEIPVGAVIEITLASPGARVITVPGDAGLTATVMVRAVATQDAR